MTGPLDGILSAISALANVRPLALPLEFFEEGYFLNQLEKIGTVPLEHQLLRSAPIPVIILWQIHALYVP